MGLLGGVLFLGLFWLIWPPVFCESNPRRRVKGEVVPDGSPMDIARFRRERL
jgi:hypothetical protein